MSVRIGSFELRRLTVTERSVSSRNPNFAVGDIVMGYGGWQDYAVANGSGLRKLNPRRPRSRPRSGSSACRA